MEAVRSSARSRRSASTPSMSGSWMSMSTRSGACSAASSTACSPVVASSVRYPVACRTSRNSFMFISLSSTTRTRSPAMARTDLAGSVNTNVLPWPSSLSTQIRPPCSSTSRFESARPRPVPSRCSTPASVCWNSSKIRSWSSGAMPGPRVGDRDPHLAVDPRRAHVDGPARGRELHGVREQVEDHLPDPALVALDDVDFGIAARARPGRRPSSPARAPSRRRARAPRAARTARPRARPGRPRPWTGRGRR